MKALKYSRDPCRDANRIIEAYPEMAILQHLRRAACSGSLDKLEYFYRSSREQLASTCSKLLDELSIERVSTLSRSSAVIECLRRSGVSEIIISESRPGLEGLDTAKLLSTEGFKVTLVVDALLPWLSRKLGFWGIVGADMVTRTHLINKIGTFPLALAVKTIAVPGLLKLYEYEHEIRERPPEEVAELRDVKVVNIYFDETPLDHLYKLVFEGFYLGPSEIEIAFERLRTLLRSTPPES